MSEYIEREALLKTLNENNIPYNSDVNYFITNAPAADVQEVKHGHWNVGYFHDRVCSCCLHPSNDFDDYPFDYCPHCGAKMGN